MHVTDRLIELGHTVQKEITPGDHGFHMFDSGSAEIEVCEFLYTLIRLMKPDRVLETGTYNGIASTYLAYALMDNQRGVLDTIEFSIDRYHGALRLHQSIPILDGLIEYWVCDSRQWNPSEDYDVVLLDTEPQQRFDEFIKIWAHVKPGGVILIHDLHPHLGHTDQTINGMYDWPYGDFRPKLGPYISSHEVQVVSFPTPRGLTMFQKTAPNFSVTKQLRADL